MKLLWGTGGGHPPPAQPAQGAPPVTATAERTERCRVARPTAHGHGAPPSATTRAGAGRRRRAAAPAHPAPATGPQEQQRQEGHGHTTRGRRSGPQRDADAPAEHDAAEGGRPRRGRSPTRDHKTYAGTWPGKKTCYSKRKPTTRNRRNRSACRPQGRLDTQARSASSHQTSHAMCRLGLGVRDPAAELSWTRSHGGCDE